MSRRTRSALAALAALALAPAAAEASTAQLEVTGTFTDRDGSTFPTYRVVVDGAPGEANDVVVQPEPGSGAIPTTAHVVDRGAPLAPGSGCRAGDGGAVLCGGGGVLDGALVRTLDGNDALESLRLTATLDGGDGNDRLTGDGQALLDGGPGADTMTGGRASYLSRSAPVQVTLDGVANDGEAGEGDRVDDVPAVLGGAGGDLLAGGAAAVTLAGGAGADRLAGSPLADTLDGGAGGDVLEAGAGRDTLAGGDGDDRLDGGEDSDTLTVDPGADVIRGGGGRDSVQYSFLNAVAISLDDVANDGLLGESDDVGSDVEVVIANAGPATLVGSDGPNELHAPRARGVVRAAAGDDLVTGGSDVDLGAGRDRLEAGAGRIAARDGERDELACRAPARVAFDAVDAIRFCVRTLSLPRRARATAGGELRLRVRCAPVRAERCRGHVTLRAASARTPLRERIESRARYSLAPGRATVVLRLDRSDMRALRRERSVRERLLVRPRERAAARTADVFTLLAPRR